MIMDLAKSIFGESAGTEEEKKGFTEIKRTTIGLKII